MAIGSSGLTSTYVGEWQVRVAYGSSDFTFVDKHTLGSGVTGVSLAYQNADRKLVFTLAGNDSQADVHWSFHGLAQGSVHQL